MLCCTRRVIRYRGSMFRTNYLVTDGKFSTEKLPNNEIYANFAA